MKMFENLEFFSIPRIVSLRLKRPTKKVFTQQNTLTNGQQTPAGGPFEGQTVEIFSCYQTLSWQKTKLF